MNSNFIILISILILMYSGSGHKIDDIGSYIQFDSDRTTVTADQVDKETLENFYEYIEAHTVAMGRFMPLDFICYDVTGDGIDDLCTSIIHGSGIVSEAIFVYDTKEKKAYDLQDRGDYDYWIDSIEDDILYVKRGKFGRKNNDSAVRGTLEFSKGELKFKRLNGTDKNFSEENRIHEAFLKFMNGDRACLEEGWQNKAYIPDFQNDIFDYEYIFLDIDEDGEDELMIQMENDPGGYNAVFNYDNGSIECWSNDSVEITCYSYPLKNGNMVLKYMYGYSTSYLVFKYSEFGSMEEIESLYIREKADFEFDDGDYPQYQKNELKTDKETFESDLKNLITDQEFERSDWTKFTGDEDE